MTLPDLAAAATPVLLVIGVGLVHAIYYLLIAKVPSQLYLSEAPARGVTQTAPAGIEATRKESAA